MTGREMGTLNTTGLHLRTGRAMAATAMLLTFFGVLAFVVMGRLDHFPLGAAMFTLFAVGFAGLGWLALPHQPSNKAIWVPIWASLLTAISIAAWAGAVALVELSGLDPSASSWRRLAPIDVPLGVTFANMVTLLGPIIGFFLMVTHWLLLFPDGKLPSPRLRWVARAATATMAALFAVLVWTYRPGSTYPFRDSLETHPEVGWLVNILYVSLVAISAVCVGSLVIRYRQSTGDERLQYRWVLLGTVALFIAVVVVGESTWQLSSALIGVTVAVVSYAVAVMKYRLYGIDVVISRTVAYGTLALFIGAVYVLVVVVLGSLIGAGSGDVALSILATAVVAVAFEPVRQRVQRWANRLVYGKRATPYEVLSDLAGRLAGTEPVPGVLTRMAELMAEGTGAEQATVWLADRSGLTAAAGSPETPVDTRVGSVDLLTGRVSPVLHDGELVGALQVVTSRGNPVTPAERRLLDDLAGSAGMVLGNQRLNADLELRAADLRASRRRLVQIQDAERRRLERDLHDGAQQQVVALKVQMSIASQMSRKRGATDLADRLAGVGSKVQGVVDEIRTLARGIYPPLLESEGLGPALRSYATQMAAPIDIHSQDLGRHPKDLESTLYFAAVETMALASERGTGLDLTLRGHPGFVELEMVLNEPGQIENGLVTVRDRVMALGGEMSIGPQVASGTTVLIRIPHDPGELPAALETSESSTPVVEPV